MYSPSIASKHRELTFWLLFKAILLQGHIIKVTAWITCLLLVCDLTAAGQYEARCTVRPCYGIMCSTGCATPKTQDNMVPLGNCPTYPVGTRIKYKCDDDHYSSSGFSTCQHNGQWSTPNLPCRKIRCGDPNEALEKCSGFTAEAKCQTVGCPAKISCDGEMVGKSEITCMRTGKWERFKCKCKFNCRNPGTEGINEIFPEKIPHGHNVTSPICTEGYKLNISMSVVVCDDGAFKPPFECELIDCGNPPTWRGMELDLYNGTFFGSVAHFMCNGTRIEALNMTCNRNSTWESDIPSNEGPCCKSNVRHLNAQFPSALKHNQTVSEEEVCSSGFTPNTQEQLVCKNGSFIPRNFGCELIDCGNPPTRQGMETDLSNGTLYGSVAYFMCNGTRTEAVIMTCNRWGTWDYAIPSIEATLSEEEVHSFGFTPHIQEQLVCKYGSFIPRNFGCETLMRPKLVNLLPVGFAMLIISVL